MNRILELNRRLVGDVQWPIKATLQARPALGSPAAYFPLVLSHLTAIDPTVDRDNVGLGCCAVENGLRRVQMDDYLTTGKFRQLRHADIYEAALQALHGNTEDTGFMIMDLAGWWKTAGIIKPDCQVREIELTEQDVNDALVHAPLICGQAAIGLMPTDLNPRGWIDESKLGSAYDMLFAGGHCMLMGASFLSNTSARCCAWKNGGWGSIGILGEGCVLSTTGWMLQTAVCKPVLITHDSGNVVGSDYERWLS